MNDTLNRRRLLVTGALLCALLLAGVLVPTFLSRNGSPPAAGATPALASSGPAASATPPTSSSAPPSTPPSSTPGASPGSVQPTPAATPSPSAPAATPSPGRTPRLGTGAVVPASPVSTKAAVPLTGTGDFGSGMSVRLSRIASVVGTASAPGEVAGPAIAVTVVARNGTSRVVDLDGVGVLAFYGPERTPASPLRAGNPPLRGALAAGASSTGTYTFSIPQDEQDAIRVEISSSTNLPIVAFEGSVGR